MKTQILQLESHDDAISTRDKMGWGQTRRVLLIWPARGRVLTRQLDLILLLRHSLTLGVQLALVTDDPQVHFNARQLGIQTFDSIHHAQETRWRRPTQSKLSRNRAQIERLAKPLSGKTLRDDPARPVRNPSALSPALRLGFFSLGVLALLCIVGIFFPSAQITLTPDTYIQEIIIPIQASASAARVSLSGVLPIRMTSAIVEGRDSLPTTGSVQIPEHYAAGRVTFTNLTDQAVTLPAETVVSSPESGVRYATDRAGRVPAGPGQMLSLLVTALAPGSAANLPSDRIQAIEGALGVNLTVTNPEPISGGREVSTPAVTPLDQSRIHNRLIAALRENALAEIQAALSPDDLLLSPLPSLARTLEESYDPPESQPASQINLALRLEFQIPTVSGEDLRSLAASVLDANLPEGYLAVPDTLEIEHLTDPDLGDDSTARWQLRARRTIQARLTPDQAIHLALGVSPTKARQRLMQNLTLSNPPGILLRPSWWPITPLLPIRISVISKQ